ncbi:hypothetical protein IFM89_028032 [Coptis chinensis]|uniref:ELM2 domain-containing protein n=1 Tax=Coptis chinensis TaxID=261450 RepID=A0A835HFZ9_9MAGN|nr:hypothetical protein IFM89_028032 [Coptis chinensis]
MTQNKAIIRCFRTPQSSVWSIKSVDSRTKKGTPTSLSFPPEAWEWSGALGKEVLLSDDTISDSNLSSPRKPFFQAPKQGPIKLLKSGNNDPRKQVRISPCKEFPHGSNLLSSKKSKKCKRPQRVVKSFDFMSDYVPRMAIPVGPRFQADIPDCIGIASRASSSDGNANVNSSAKRLGTLVWPIEDRDAEFSGELIGKGRPSTCLCQSPGSPGCVKLHVSDERVRLKFDISSAFYSWKFDEMGEEVSKSWTPAEEKRFRIVVKMNPVSSDMSFLNPSLKCLPSKSRESILSYYYNVFVLNRMSRQTRLTSTDVDSDDDETNEGVGQSKDVKHHYLIGLR